MYNVATCNHSNSSFNSLSIWWFLGLSATLVWARLWLRRWIDLYYYSYRSDSTIIGLLVNMKKRKKITPMKYPIHIEASYKRQLHWMNDQMRKSIKRHLHPIIPSITDEAANIHTIPTGEVSRAHHARSDAGWQDDLYDAFQKISSDMIAPKAQVTRQMIAYAPKVNQYNQKEWKDLIRSQYGINPTREDPETYWPLMREWAQDNAALIKDIPDKAIEQMSQLTQDVLFSGKTQDDMVDDIYDLLDDRMDITDRRANLIARDQVSKLNGRFTHERQVDNGVDSYVWRTVGDERVRETHAAVDGQTFSWDAPPDETDGNHPGEDYQCRCWAEPVLPDTLEVEADILPEGEDETALEEVDG